MCVLRKLFLLLTTLAALLPASADAQARLNAETTSLPLRAFTEVLEDPGDLAPFSSRPFVHRNLVFPLALVCANARMRECVIA